ncbi:MAG: ABC transporter ATP-binding protein [Nitrospiraceae bacterium]|nr:ABC transporter ATP-binding protein [Nitrospiraceae bacterium]
MSNIALSAERIDKLYHVGRIQDSYRTLRDTLSEAFVSPLRRASKILRGQASGAAELDDSIWALKDVSFQVEKGEVVGFIGRNGAGKSTLLKILSRITEPTSGYAEIHGRVGSLLEVGTGFHPELTGRENVYLNGAILGMKRIEIERKFEAIVSFAEVEKFVDTPVKHYSSGMYLRLAFAVAAHLEPEILLVDEVLAVGDMAFQQKCLGKMRDVAVEGRTVLFVSHNMSAIQSLCSRAIFLKDGKITFQGSTEQAVKYYCASVQKLYEQPIYLREDRSGGEQFRFTSVQFLNPRDMTPVNVFVSGQPAIIRIGYINRAKNKLEDVGIGITFSTMTNTHLFGCKSRVVGTSLDIPPGEGYTDCLISKWPLKAGRYVYNLFAEKNNISIDWLSNAGACDVEAGDYYGSGILPAPHLPGVLVDYAWRPTE